MVEHRAYDWFWVPSDGLDMVQQELQDSKAWLASPKGAPTLVPRKAPAQVAGPSQTDAPTQEAVTPRQPGLVSMLRNLETPMPRSKGTTQPAQDVKEGESPEREGDADLDQGEDKPDDAMDGTTTPEAGPARRRTQVAEQDRKEHLLAAGKWFGLGAMQKANEIRIDVSEAPVARRWG